MKRVFTKEEFDNLLETDNKFKQMFEEYLSFQKWLAIQSRDIQKEVDAKLKEKVRNLRP